MGGTKGNSSAWLELGKFFLTTVIAAASASWTARGVIASYDKRIAVLETVQQMDSQRLADIGTDVREIRAAVMQQEAKR